MEFARLERGYHSRTDMEQYFIRSKPSIMQDGNLLIYFGASYTCRWSCGPNGLLFMCVTFDLSDNVLVHITFYESYIVIQFFNFSSNFCFSFVSHFNCLLCHSTRMTQSCKDNTHICYTRFVYIRCPCMKF